MLSEAQKIEIRQILRVRKDAITYLLGQSALDALNAKLASLSADQITAVGELLTEWDKVKYATGVLKGDYNDDPARKRSLIKERLVTTIDFDPADYGIGGCLEIGRG
jgi:hypothetical protein